MAKLIPQLLQAALIYAVANLAHAKLSITPIESALPLSADVQQSLEQHPLLMRSAAELDYALALQQKFNIGDNPWTFNTGLQMRRADASNEQSSSSHSYEPSIGIEKQLRLPSKLNLDRELGQSVLNLAELAYLDQWHEASKLMLMQWFDYLTALSHVQRSQEQLQLIQQQMDILTQRVRIGDVARLELMLLSNQQQQVQAQLLQNQSQVQHYQLILKRYFSGQLPSHFSTDQIQLLDSRYSQQDWVDSVLNDNHELKLAQRQAQHMHSLLQRQQLDKRPDPTVGLGYSQEQKGAEHLISLSLSIPLSTQQVKVATKMAQAEAKKADIAAEQIKRRLIDETILSYQQLQQTQQRIQHAQTLSSQLQNQHALMNKAYKLGEINLNELLLHSQQLIESKSNLDQAKIDYAKNMAILLLNSHLIWTPTHLHDKGREYEQAQTQGQG
ncbi:outer membrane protein TolC [Acinetobacter calcoaceticus]|uniref:Outer membrane protein TolC n=1 Tax=Acinetobacter calcoaceticus TaxID=471 RepID=A0A4R1XEU0_ACICA|nr:outer membrane protein TolC [Acinetobacter calcoaceticus]